MVKRWIDHNLKGDPVIWSIVFILALLSIMVVYSSTGTMAYRKMGNSESYLIKQAVLIALGLVAMWLAHKIDYRYYARLSRFALIISAPLLLITYKFGVRINDASRWIVIPVIDQAFQPSDLAKLALIANLAAMLARRQNNRELLKEGLLPMLLWCGGICGLIALSNFSTAAMLFITCMLLMFIGRVPSRYLLMLVGVGIIAGFLAFKIGQRGNTFLNRIESFVDSFSDPRQIPFQAEQSYIAIANGGVFGQGPGNSHQKDFLPLAYADFIYAIILEEYGLVGGFMVLLLYLLLLYRGLMAMQNSANPFGGLLSAGLSFSLAMQAMFNMAVAVGLIPITGQPLPLLSMGGTSLLFTGISLGIILSVSRGEIDEDLPVYKAKTPDRYAR